jgi:hypothetical protein
VFIRVHPWLLLLLASPLRVLAQETVGGTVTDFKMPVHDTQNRLRSLVTGKSAKTVGGLTVLRLEGLRLETYGTNGALDLVAEAPECIFDIKTKTASSAGALKAEMADQRLSISGVGFEYRQDEGTLVVSNQVRTMLRRELIMPRAKP